MDNEYFLGNQRDEGGVETDRRARIYAKENGCDYATAVNAVLREARADFEGRKARADERAGYREQSGWRIYADANGDVQEVSLANGGTAIIELSNVVAGLPRLPDHSIDATKAAQTINASFRQLGQDAAGGFLAAIALKQMSNRRGAQPEAGTNDPYGNMFATEFKNAASEYPEVMAVYDGARMTVEALQQILWPMFRTPQQFSSRNDVKKYASHDGAGRVYHDGVAEVHRH